MDSLLLTSIASSLSGIIGKFLFYPLDTIKAQCYIDRKPIQFNFKDIIQTSQTIYSQGGFRQFYKGGLIAIAGSGPAFSLYLTSYEFFKQNISIKQKLLLHLICGLLAETISGILWLPIDVVKERLQVQKKLGNFNYSGSIDAIIKIIKQEGLRGLYRGFGATLGFFGPYSALYFAGFEYFNEITNRNTLISSLGAFLCASILTQPLSVSKLRIQVQFQKNIHIETQASKFNYKNQIHGIFRIFKEEGLKALFRGYLMRCFYAGSLTTFNMTSTELIKRKFKN